MIITTPTIFTLEQVTRIEEKKNAKYVCETCLRGKDGWWINAPVAVFWNRDPASIPPRGSPWFGLFYKYDWFHDTSTLMITNAISAVEDPITGIRARNGDIIYSRFRHDFRRSPDESVWIDGGRDYTRYSTPGLLVNLRIVDGDLVESKE